MLKNRINQYLLFFSVLAVIFFSCREKQDIPDYIVFPQEKKLTSHTINIDTVLFRYPFRIRIDDKLAYIFDLHNSDYYFHIFSYPEFHYLTSFGKRGEGPKELTSPENIRLTTHKETWTLDSSKRILTKTKYLAETDSIYTIKTISLDDELLHPLDFVNYNDTAFISPDYLGKSRLCMVNSEGKLIRRIGEIPTNQRNLLLENRPVFAQAWRSFIDYNPQNGILATATQQGEILEIYNLRTGMHTRVSGPNGEPKFQIVEGQYAIPNGIKGFIDIQLTNKYIYTIFQGISKKERQQKMQKGIKMPEGGQYIYVFTTEGKPVIKYELDCYIEGLSVDEKNNIITALNVNADQPIVQFKL